MKLSPRVLIRPRILVTGLGGLIGSRLAAAAGEGFDLVGLGRAQGVDLTDGADFMRAAEARPEANALIHLAAFTDVSAAHAQKGDRNGGCFRVNVLGTRNVVRACKALGLHLIHVSTDFVFDGAKDAALTERDLPSPIEWYGETKLMAEREAREAPSWTILRISFPFAPPPAARADVVRRMHDRLAAGEELGLFTDQIVTPTWSEDVARGLLLTARLKPRNEVFHLTGSSPLTPFDLGLKIARLFRFEESLVRPSLMADVLTRDPRPRQRRLRMSNAKWSAFAARNGLSTPLGVDGALSALRRAMAGDSA